MLASRANAVPLGNKTRSSVRDFHTHLTATRSAAIFCPLGLPPDELAKFLRAIDQLERKEFMSELYNVNITKGNASNPDDKVKVLEYVEQGAGIHQKYINRVGGVWTIRNSEIL